VYFSKLPSVFLSAARRAGSVRDELGGTYWLLNSPASNGKKAAEPLPRGGCLKTISFGAILSRVKMSWPIAFGGRLLLLERNGVR
jgi:hypothetical protein